MSVLDPLQGFLSWQSALQGSSTSQCTKLHWNSIEESQQNIIELVIRPVDFQGKVGLKTWEVRDKKKAAKKAKRAEMKKLSLHSRAESRKLKAQSKSG